MYRSEHLRQDQAVRIGFTDNNTAVRSLKKNWEGFRFQMILTEKDLNAVSTLLVQMQPEMVFIRVTDDDAEALFTFGKLLQTAGIPVVFFLETTEGTADDAALSAPRIGVIGTLPSVLLPKVQVIRSPNYKIVQQGGSKTLRVRKGKFDYYLPYKDICHLVIQKKHIIIHTRNLILRMALQIDSFLDMLDQSCFVRIHRHYVINAELLDNMTYKTAVVNKCNLPIGRYYKHNLQTHLQKMMCR